MELWQLNYFTKVVEEGSISAAARKLHMSQPPLSLQIKRLESELGVSLFIRDGRNMTVTAAGSALYQRANAILSLTSITVKEVLSVANGVGEILRLGSTSSSGHPRIRETILNFHQKFPAISFEMYERSSYYLLEMLENRQLDIAFVRTPFPKKDFRCLPLLDEPLMAIGKDSFFSSEDQSVTVSWLENRPLLIYRRWEELIRSSFDKMSTGFYPLCINDDARTCLNWAETGIGIAVMPFSTPRSLEYAQLSAHSVTDLGIRSTITLVMRQTEHSKPAMDFFKLFEDTFKKTKSKK